MNLRKFLVAAAAAIAVVAGPMSFPSMASATPVVSAAAPDLYNTNTVTTSSSSNTQDFVTYNGVTYFSSQTPDYGRAIVALSAPGAEPQLISHTDMPNYVGTSANIYVEGHYLLYTNSADGSAPRFYAVDLNTNTTTALDDNGPVLLYNGSFSGYATVGSKIYFGAAKDLNSAGYLYSFDMSSASLTNEGSLPAWSIFGLTSMGNSLYAQTGDLVAYDTVANTWSTVDSPRIMAVAGKFTFQGNDVIIYSKMIDGGDKTYYTLATDGTITQLGSWSSTNETSFVNMGGNLYAYTNSNWGTTHTFAIVDTDGSLISLNDYLFSGASAINMQGWQVVGDQMTFLAYTDLVPTEYLYKWDGSGPAIQMSTVHSPTRKDPQYSDFFSYPTNVINYSTPNHSVGVVGNTVITNAWLDDSIGWEPYLFGLDGSVTLVKDFSTFSNGFNPSMRCPSSSGSTDYVVGSTPTSTIDGYGATPTLARFTAGTHKLFGSTYTLAGLNDACGFVDIGGVTYFVGTDPNRMDSTGLYSLNAVGQMNRLFSLSGSIDGAFGFTDGTNYYFLDTDGLLHKVDIAAQTDTVIVGGDGTSIPYLESEPAPVVAGDKLYFVAVNQDYYNHLYSLDLTNPTARPVILDTKYTNAYSYFFVRRLALSGNKVLFAASDGVDAGDSVFELDPADDSTTKLFNVASVSGGVQSLFAIGSTIFVRFFNFNDYTNSFYKWTQAGGVDQLNFSFEVDDIAKAGTSLAVSDTSKNLYLYDTSGNLLNERDGVLADWALYNEFSSDNGMYMRLPESNITGYNHTYGNELAYVGSLDPVFTTRLGQPVSELPVAPFTGTNPTPETQLPDAPTNVVGVAVDGQINLTWDAPTTGGPVRDYTVTSTPGNGHCTTDGTTAVCTDLVAGTPFTFTVQAINGAGSSDPSTASAPIVAPMVAGKPTISGNVRLTQTVTGLPGGWFGGAGAVHFAYQWLLDGAAIPGANARTYRIANSDLGHKLSVSVTGSHAGLASRTMLSPQTKVGSAVVTIFGSARFGSTLTVDPGIWPDGYALSYQWYANKNAIDGATGTSYTIQPSNVQNRIYVKVTGTRAGSPTYVKTSKSTGLVLLGRLVSTPAPTIYGDAFVNGVLCVNTGSWDTDVNVAVQWYRNGRAINGETNTCYFPMANDYRQMITVKVTGSKPSYIPKTVTSAATRIIGQELGGTLDTPAISGDAVVGSTLTVDPMNAFNIGGDVVSYQWLDTGRIIKGATDSTYTIPAKRKGHRISVRVTVSKQYYRTQTSTSERTAAVTN